MTDKLYFCATPRMNFKKNLMYSTTTNNRFVRALVAGIAVILPTVGLAATVTFQQGVGGYSGNVDTYVSQTDPGTAFGTAVNVLVDNAAPIAHGLIRFDNIFGPGAGQVPVGATINSATLTVRTFNDGDTVRFHRMLKPWTPSDTWNSLVNGLSADNVEALSTIDASFTGAVPVPRVDAINLTAAVQSWADGSVTNNGWAVLPTAGNGWQIDSADATTAANRPLLTINFTPPGVTVPITITTQPQSQNAVIGTPVTFTVEVIGTAPRYLWYRNSTPIPNATNSSYTIPSAQFTNVGNYYVVVTNSISSATSSNALLSVTFPPVVFLTSSNAWKYHDQGVDLGDIWRATAYNDSAWSNGLSVFAFNAATPPDEALPAGNTIRTQLRKYTVANPSVQIVTYYFRTAFNFTNNPGDVILTASNLLDDGAVFYINGAELTRVVMPTGPILYGTGSTRADDISGHGWDVFNVPVSALVQGTNVVAVELHQGGTASSDAVFSMQLWANFPAPTLLTITNEPQDVTLEELKQASFSVGVGGTGARLQWYRQGVGAISNATFSTFTIPNVSTNDDGFYYVVATNVINSVTSRLARLTVLPDTNGPTLVDADGTAALNKVLVSFSEVLLATTATNTANYKITNTLGGTLNITSAVFTNGTNVLLTTDSRVANNNYILIVNRVRDTSPRQNVIATNSMIPISQLITIVALNGSTWRFYFDLFGNNDPGPNWRNLVYDDSGSAGWGVGSAGFAYFGGEEEAPFEINTSLSYGVASYYFRIPFAYPFSVPVSRSGAQLSVRHGVDDGAIFYFNTQEVFRTNLPSGTVTPTTFALTTLQGPSLSEFINVPFDSLVFGSNIFAVEVHISSTVPATDETVAFAAEMRLKFSSLLVGPAIITSQPQNQTVAEGSPVTFNATVVAGVSFQWQQNGTNIPGATDVSLTIPSVPFSYNGSTFRILATGTNGVSMIGSNATLTVIADTNRPSLISAFANQDNSFTLAFSEFMSPTTAANLANYLVTNAAGQSLTISSATVTNGSNIVLRFNSYVSDAYWVYLHDLRDTSVATNYITNTLVKVGFNLVISMNDVWKYNQTGADLGSAWQNLNYDDLQVGWSNGAALLYNEGAALPGPKNTPLSLTGTNGNYTFTFYFRKKVNLPITSTNLVYSFRHIIDDGAVFYRNSLEFHRFNMPEGVPTYTTQASAPAIGDAGLNAYTLTNVLSPGTNVIAVEVHQTGTTSSDVVFGAELIASIPSVVTVITGSPSCNPVSWPGPILKYQQVSRTNLVLSWANPTDNCGGIVAYTLQGALGLSNPPASTVWSNLSVTSPYNVIIPTNAVPVPFGTRFYQLRRF